jgi:signal transduction histidine kinase
METMGTALDKLGIRCSVLLAEEDGGDVFRLRYQSGPEGLLRRISEMLGVPLIGLPVRRSQLGQVKRPALISDPVSAATRALPGIAHSVLHTVTRLLGMTPETPTARLPLLVGEEAIGVLIVWGRELVASDLPALSVFASQVAIALQNARSLKAESAARAQAETLREVAGVLSSSLELDHVLDLILRQLARVVVFDSASIMLIRGDGYYVAARHGRLTGLDAGTSLKRYMLPGIDAIIDERRPVIVSDTEIDPDWVSFTDSQRIRSWLGVPLLVKNEVIGVLNINKDRPSFYTEEDASLATAFAQQAALAIENARLFVQVRRYAYELEQRVIARTQDLATLYDVAAITSKPLDLETVLQRSIQSMFMRLDCHGGAVYLQDEAEESLRLAAALGVPRQLVEHNESPLAETGILEQVMTLGNPAVSTFRGQSVAGLEGEWTCTGVPMRFRGHSFGVLVVYSEGREPFDREELALLGSFADHMAAAVENARLRQQASQLAILKERERLAGELHDSVTQSLYSLRLFSEAAREQLESQHVARASDYMQDISATARRALKEMRLLLYELRSDSYLKDGLLAALYHRLDAVEKRAGVKTAIEMDSLLELPSALEEMLYRVAQEALNNALKHAEANNMTVRVKLEGAQVRMEVEDDGRGFDTSHDMPAGGMGLENMQRRVREFGGTLDIVSAPGAGTRVIVQVPVSRRGLQAAARDVAGEQDEILPIRDWPSP